MSIAQLPLWEETKSSDTQEAPFTWANGDSSQRDLEQLAAILLKHHRTSLRCIDGRSHLFKVIATRIDIESGCVIGTVEPDIALEKTLGMFKNSLPDEDEEC